MPRFAGTAPLSARSQLVSRSRVKTLLLKYLQGTRDSRFEIR